MQVLRINFLVLAWCVGFFEFYLSHCSSEVVITANTCSSLGSSVLWCWSQCFFFTYAKVIYWFFCVIIRLIPLFYENILVNLCTPNNLGTVKSSLWTPPTSRHWWHHITKMSKSRKRIFTFLPYLRAFIIYVALYRKYIICGVFREFRNTVPIFCWKSALCSWLHCSLPR